MFVKNRSEEYDACPLNAERSYCPCPKSLSIVHFFHINVRIHSVSTKIASNGISFEISLIA
jgi:hypothetical protein